MDGSGNIDQMTIDDIARAAGVSKGAISKLLTTDNETTRGLAQLSSLSGPPWRSNKSPAPSASAAPPSIATSRRRRLSRRLAGYLLPVAGRP